MLANKRIFKFKFLGLESEKESCQGIVTAVGDEQILEVESEDGRPYIIVGRRRDGMVYEGKHFGPKGDSDVVVRWVDDDDSILMGLWVEDDIVYSFTANDPNEIIPYDTTGS
jgi:hypothetical protein